MARRRSARIGWLGAALLFGALVPTQAQAVIPYDTLITPGQLRGIAYAPGDPWIYGYWEYLPTNFDEFAPDSLPLLVFMAGIGEYDDVSSCPGGVDVCTNTDCGGDGLCRNLTWGPQQLMATGQWDDVLRPFIMVSPQHPIPPFTTQPWNVANLDAFFQFIVDNYPVDTRRMYLIGMSQGGRGVLQYTQAYPRRFTAVAPTPGGQVDADVSCYFQDTALWVFHGENDADGNLGPGVFNPCNMVGVAYQYNNPGDYVGYPQCVSIVGQPRPTGRLTMYYNVAHSSWIQTVNPINAGFAANEWASDQGCGIPATFRQYEAALDPDGVYSWFLSLDRPGVVAPDDFMIDMPQTSLTATITDDDPVTIEWTQTAGPAAVLANANTDTLDVSGLVPMEQYTFQVYVVDADNQWNLDEVTVSTADMFGGGGSSSSGGGESSTDGGESTGVTATTGGAETTGSAETTGNAMTTGVSGDGSTGGGATSTDDGSMPDGTGNTPGDGSGGMATSAGPGGTMTGDSGDGPGADDDGSGCGCTTDGPRPGGWWAWAMVMLAIRRRHRRGPAHGDA